MVFGWRARCARPAGKIPGNSGLSVGSQYFIVVTFANYLDSFQAWFQAVYRTGS
ncbi:MAG TPA: hypothetical protein VEI07_07125 [Planctomycetaceae bacterium]|nr:hypothetical protein [Planctomycetaceae bacterium]